MLRLVLASQSPARLSTLRRAGIEPVVIVSGIDEDQLGPLPADTLALELSTLKATAVVNGSRAAEIPPDALVLACDSVLELDGEVLGKPHTAVEATARWRAMRGRSGALVSGHTVIDTCSGAQVRALARTAVHFADVDDSEIDAYVASGEPLEVAGAFTVDGLGGAFITGIEGDFHNVVGVSLPLVRRLVSDLGHRWTDLWNVPYTDTAQ
jgi:septum formation protein